MKFLLFIMAVLFLAFGSTACGENTPEVQSAVYVTIADFTHKYEPGATAKLPVKILTLGQEAWEGTVSLRVMRDETVMEQTEQAATVNPESELVLEMETNIPAEVGTYHFVAELKGFQNQPVRSRRLIEVELPLRVKIN